MAAAGAGARAAASVVVVGGAGVLGRSLVSSLRQAMATDTSCGVAQVISLDLRPSPEATHSIRLPPALEWHAAGRQVLAEVQALTAKELLPVRGVLHVAGGWGGGGVDDEAFLEGVDRMWKMNLQSAALAAHLAGVLLTDATQPGGLVVLTGAAAGLDAGACTGMVGYGLSKAATHFLTQILARDPSLAAASSTALSILPATIDTPANRAAMPKAEFGTWTKV